MENPRRLSFVDYRSGSFFLPDIFHLNAVYVERFVTFSMSQGLHSRKAGVGGEEKGSWGGVRLETITIGV